MAKARIKRSAERGQPCLTERRSGMSGVIRPLRRTDEDAEAKLALRKVVISPQTDFLQRRRDGPEVVEEETMRAMTGA